MIHVAAFDDAGVRAHLYDFSAAASISATSLIVMPVRISASGIFGVMTDERFRSSVTTNLMPGRVEQFRSARRFHDRIVNDMLKLSGVEKFRDNGRVSAIAEHADFHRRNFGIVREAIELRA